MWFAHMALFPIGFALIHFGFRGIFETTPREKNEFMLPVAMQLIGMGVMLWFVLFAVEGMGLGVTAVRWGQAEGEAKETLFAIAQAIYWISEFGLNSFAIIVLTSGVGLFALALRHTHFFPQWLIWGCVISSAAASCAGFMLALSPVFDVPLWVFIDPAVGAFLISMLLMGIHLFVENGALR